MVVAPGSTLVLRTRSLPSLSLGVQPVHVTVACTVCSASADLLSLTAMLEAGWSFAWTPTGHFVEVPGVRRFSLRAVPGGSCAFIDVVLIPGTEADPKVTIFDAEDPAQLVVKYDSESIEATPQGRARGFTTSPVNCNSVSLTA